MVTLDTKKFMEDAIEQMKRQVGDRKAIVAMSFGVDSSVVAALAATALPKQQFEAWYIDTGFMRKDEYRNIAPRMKEWGLNVKKHNGQKDFFSAMAIEKVLAQFHPNGGPEYDEEIAPWFITDGEEKREAFRNTFYVIFGQIVEERKATCLLQGTNAADLKMFAKGQTQHNVDIPHKDYGIEVMVEPVIGLYKPQIRQVARALGLPDEISERQPFPGPGLMVRCLGAVTREKIGIVREAQYIVEGETDYLEPFQSIAAIAGDEVTGMTKGKKAPGHYMIFVRVVDSTDAMTAKALRLPENAKRKLEERILALPNVAHVLFDETPKPPATIEYY